jgi:hypothetical protein
MARPQKTGLDYFPLDVGFYRDVKVRKLMRSNGGGKALAVYVVLLCNIYENGYYMVWDDDDVPFMLSEILGFEEGTIHEAIKFCLSIGLLDKELFTSQHILTSRSIQSRYLTAVKRRVRDVSDLPYIYADLLSETEFMSTETGLLHTETPFVPPESTQNKKKVNDKSSLRSDSSPSSPTSRVRENGKNGLMPTETVFMHTETPFLPDEKVGVRKAVEWLKQQRDWLLQMQQFHGIHAARIQQWLDLFVNECACRGKKEHESLSDVMQHFNDWLKYKTDPRRKGEKKNGRNDTPNVPMDYQKQWMKCLAELCQSVSPEEAARTFGLMRFESFDTKAAVLLIQLPSNDVFERLEKDHVQTLSRLITKYFGNCKLKYRIKRSA